MTNVYNQNTGTYGAYGMNINGGANHTVRNNFISGIIHNMSGGAAFDLTFGVVGIRVAGTSTGHKFYHNSVYMTGLTPGTAASSLLSAAFGVAAQPLQLPKSGITSWSIHSLAVPLPSHM